MGDAGKEIVLPSGMKLSIHPAPFMEAKALYQALLKELKVLKLDPKAEVDVNFFKDLFCAGFSSSEVEDALWACMRRCLYNKQQIKVVADAFESVESREDYLVACYEIALENINPFAKSLYAKYSHLLDLLKKESVPA